jgi:two-component system LytT family sensor kinase
MAGATIIPVARRTSQKAGLEAGGGSGLKRIDVGDRTLGLKPDLADEEERVRASSRRRATLILIGAFWAFAVLMLTVRAALIDQPAFGVISTRRLVTAALGALLCLAMARLLALLRNRSFSERVVWGVIGAFAMAFTLTMATMIFNRIVLPFPGAPPINLTESAQWILVWLGYFLAWTGTQLALIYHWESSDHQRRAALLAESTRQAQMAALRYQLNPHFLFNTLNSISSLVGEERNADAETMLLNLATFVRSTLTDEPTGTIALRDEIELQRLYLDIEQARFGDRLKVEIDLPEALAEVQVPALILQPLVENAIHHGVGRSEDPLTLRIAAALADGRIEIGVEDDGTSLGSGAGSGVGLRNVAARLAAHYGDGATLDAAPRDGGGYRATIAFPRKAL